MRLQEKNKLNCHWQFKYPLVGCFGKWRSVVLVLIFVGFFSFVFFEYSNIALSQAVENQAEEFALQGELMNEEETDEEVLEGEEISLQEVESFASLFPALKERRLQKLVWLDKNSRHFCVVNNFIVNLTVQDQVITELKLKGSRSDVENIEIGSLPLGIDVTFLDNSGYEHRPQQSDNGAVLQITNQPGSQKGNFSIPIIYQSGDSTTICQINIINF